MRRPASIGLRAMAWMLAMGTALPVAAQDAAATFNAAKALGQSMALSGSAAVKNGSAENSTVRLVVPGYTSDPVEAQTWRNANPAAVAAQRKAQCALTPTDPVCAAAAVGTTARPTTALVPPGHPALAGQAAVADPTRVLGDIATTYNACSVGGALTAPERFVTRGCLLGADPWTRHTCFKTLTASPVASASCTLGSVLASARLVRGGADVMEVQALCALGQTPNVRIRADARGGRGACVAPLDVPVDLSQPVPATGGMPVVLGHLAPHWGGSCQALAVVWEGPGCQNGLCSLNVHFVVGEGVRAARRCSQPGEVLGSRITFRGNDAPQSDLQCYSAFAGPDDAVGRVGGWAQVDSDETYWWAATSDSVSSGWEWSSGERWTAALSFAEPRLKPAAGDIWTNGCSTYEPRTPGLAPDGVPPSDPVPMLAPAPEGTSQCVRTVSVCTDGPSTRVIDGVPVTRECWAYRNTFDCSQVATGSGCADPALRSCNPLSRQCLATDALGRCTQTRQELACPAAGPQFAPALNCGAAQFCADGSCWQDAQPPNDGFAMAVSQLQAHMDAAADFDPDAMQVFKGRDSRCTRDNFGLDNCCENNAALLQRCSAEMQETVRQREQGRCMQVGDYCSAHTWLGVCRETTKTYCCFSSLLAKLVQVQGRQQIGREWGTATEPACRGFRPEEIAALDWSAFDLSDFYAQIQVTPPPSAADLSGSAQAAQPRCYFGAGRC